MDRRARGQQVLKTYEDAKVPVEVGEHDVSVEDVLLVEKRAAEKKDAP
jgi:hypothetical protein